MKFDELSEEKTISDKRQPQRTMRNEDAQIILDDRWIGEDGVSEQALGEVEG